MTEQRSICWASLCLCLWLGLGVVPPASGGAQRLTDLAGGEDPFAALSLASKPATSAPAQVVESNEPPPELFMESIVLRFLDPNSVVSVLDCMRTPHGRVSVNRAGRSVVLCDTRENLDRMIAQVKKADRTPLQVMVEVVLLDVQLKDDSEIGVNWDLLSNERYPLGYRQNLTSSRLSSTPETGAETTTDTLGHATAFNSLGAGGDISVVLGTVRNVLHLVQQKRNVNILADPKMLVVSGKSATINAVEQIPYREVTDTGAGGQGALTSTQFKDVGVKLEVAVIVTDDNDIFLTVSSEQSVKTGDSEGGIPVVDSRKANTSLLLKDGQTVVIGGLRREEKTRQVNQIPLLGDLPLIGFLFRSTTEGKSKSELVVLLSPRLSQGGIVPAEAAARVENVHREDWLRRPMEDEPKTKSTKSDAAEK
jgi:type II secretory pathway component GspD/PulD (secretin)